MNESVDHKLRTYSLQPWFQFICKIWDSWWDVTADIPPLVKQWSRWGRWPCSLFFISVPSYLSRAIWSGETLDFISFKVCLHFVIMRLSQILCSGVTVIICLCRESSVHLSVLHSSSLFAVGYLCGFCKLWFSIFLQSKHDGGNHSIKSCRSCVNAGKRSCGH